LIYFQTGSSSILPLVRNNTQRSTRLLCRLARVNYLFGYCSKALQGFFQVSPDEKFTPATLLNPWSKGGATAFRPWLNLLKTVVARGLNLQRTMHAPTFNHTFKVVRRCTKGRFTTLLTSTHPVLNPLALPFTLPASGYAKGCIVLSTVVHTPRQPGNTMPATPGNLLGQLLAVKACNGST